MKIINMNDLTMFMNVTSIYPSMIKSEGSKETKIEYLINGEISNKTYTIARFETKVKRDEILIFIIDNILQNREMIVLEKKDCEKK